MIGSPPSARPGASTAARTNATSPATILSAVASSKSAPSYASMPCRPPPSPSQKKTARSKDTFAPRALPADSFCSCTAASLATVAASYTARSSLIVWAA
eukprot:scaffold79558_cov61-Phaeocystis_antarctica.AAC.1